MKNRNYKMCLMFFCIIIVFSSFSDISNDACMEQLKGIYKKMNAINSTPSKGKRYYMDYTVRTATDDSSRAGITASRIQTWMDDKHLQIKSKEMEIYQDDLDVFTVLPQQKIVLRADADKHAGKDKLRKTTFIQDTLFSLSKVTECQDLKDDKANKKIVLSLNTIGQERFHISKITFLLQTEKQEVKKIRVDYVQKRKEARTKNNEIVYVEYTFNEISFDSKKVLNDKVKDVFLHSESELNSNYKGYKLIDNRNKK